MNMLKKSLAMFLALCMLFSAAPMTVFAEEIDSTNPIVTEATEETTAPAETVPETTVALETVPETTVALETVPQETVPQETVPQETIPQETVSQEMISQDLLPQVTVPQVNDPLSMITTDVDADIAPTAITMGTKPDNGTTKGEPFPKGTGGSNSFRIPALVTLKNGTLVAAADARWNTTYDGGGLDTIVSISTDGGMNWSYQFANYLGDNGNEYNGTGSTTFIDPALAVTGNTVYMLVDIYPYGVALNGDKDTAPVTGTGFNSKGKLLLSGNNHGSYNYYLDGNTIYGSDGQPVSGYTVDENFNITSTDGSTNSNLFFSDSPFKVVRTGFLYLTKSTDGGKNWSAPELLNLKTSSEQVCLVGPGRGLVTSDGKVIFPVYSYNGSDSSQKMGFISYNGKSWSRSDSMTGATWSSESAVVELTGGTLRFFYRNNTTNLCYVDYKDGWGTPVVMNGSNGTECIDTNSNCQISAITYSKTVDGKKLILVSCPTGPNEAGSDQSGASYRLNGKIFAFTVEADGSLKKAGAISVTSNNAQFMYSCLTELEDGTVGILYEDHQSKWGTGNGYYYTMSYVEYDLAASMKLTFDGATTEPESDVTITEGATMVSATKVENVAALAGQTYVAYDITVSEADVTSATVVINLKGAFADDDELVAYYINDTGAIAETIEGTYDTEADTFTFVATHFSTYAVGKNRAATNITNTVNVRIPVGKTSETYTVNGVYVTSLPDLNTGVATATLGGDKGSEATVSYLAVSVTNGTLLNSTTTTKTATGYYHKTDNGYYPLHATRSRNGMSRYDYNWYYSADGGETFVDCGSETRVYSTATPSITVYRKSGNEGTPAFTTVQFKGVSVGNTSAVIGTTQYNITVYKEVDVKINYTVDGETVVTGTVKAASDSAVTATITLPDTVTDGTNTYRVNNTTLTLKDGVNATYEVEVILLDGEEVEIKERETKEISVELSAGQYVEWSSSDSSYVGVAGKYDTVNETYTENATIIGYTVTDAPVVISGTIYNADGSVAGVEKWLVMVTDPVSTTGGTGTRYIKLTIDKIENCDVYYSINGGKLIKINGTGLLIEETVNAPELFNITFFAAPHDGYALTKMAATNTADFYYPLSNGNPDGTGSDAWPFVNDNYSGDAPSTGGDSAWKSGHGFRWFLIQKNMTVEQMKILFSNAIALGCDGATTITMNNLDNGSQKISELEFIAQKMPTIQKTVNGILPTSYLRKDFRTYEDGMVATVNELIYYTVTVTLERPTTWKTTNGQIVTDAYGQIGAIEYSDAFIKDIIDNAGNGEATFYVQDYDKDLNGVLDADEIADAGLTGQDLTKQYITDELNKGWADDETTRTLNFYVVYKIQEEDIPGNTIKNKAQLSYGYKSAYSAGSYGGSAIDEATITVVGSPISPIVVDFGLPVTISDLTHSQGFEFVLQNGYTTKATAGYGDVTVVQTAGAGTADTSDDKFSVTYTPNKILQGRDIIYLYNAADHNKVVNMITVYPATTVYYEEGFLFTDASKIVGTWKYLVDNELPENQVSNKGRGPQAAVVLGHAGTNNFGYDDHYAGTTTDPMMGSDGTWAMSDAVDDTTSFTFTGTGFQLYANSDTGSGIVSVYSKGGIQRIYTIDTGLKVPTVDQNGNAISPNSLADDVKDTKTYYSLPVVSETSLPYGTYIVTIRHTKDDKPVYLDGVRIFNTLESSTVFTSDLEDNPVFHELRDHVLKAIGVENLNDSDYIDGGNDSAPNDNRDGKIDEVNQMAGQVYNALAAADGTVKDVAVVLNQDGTTFTAAQAQEMLDDGPKNELYLYPGQSLAFSVTTNRVMQLGLKSPIGDAKFTITVDGDELDLKSLSTTVDMFYKIAAKGGTTHNVTITVNSGVLSVTTLKVCDDPNFSFNTLTQEDIENALLGIFGLDEVENPFEDVVEDDFFFDAVLWAVNGGITNGMDDTHFIPTGMCNRAQIVTFLWRAMGKPAPTTTVNPFVDVTESDFFYDAVLWAHENGITNGVDATHFNPTGECNRAQAVTFLWRAVGEPESTADVDFTDVQPGQFYSASVAWAFEKGITNGMGDGTFGVLESCNRAQVVTFLYRALAPR